jgi:uncharacterized membrane protein
VAIASGRSLEIAISIGLVSLFGGVYVLHTSAYELEIHNKMLAFNFWIVTVSSFFVILDNLALLEESSLYVCLIAELFLLYLAVGFGFYLLLR